jgi:PAS domain S-box-containing protein
VSGPPAEERLLAADGRRPRARHPEERGTEAPMRRLVVIAVTAFFGIGLSAAAYLFVQHHESQRERAAFVEAAKSRLTSVRHDMSSSIMALQSLGGLFHIAPDVDRARFAGFAESLWRDESAARFFAWVPRVPGSRRAAIESKSRSDGLDGFAITEASRGDRAPPATGGAEYFPIYFAYPAWGNERLLGLDLASEPSYRAALDKARDSGEAAAVAWTTPVSADAGTASGLLVVLPVYMPGEANAMIGRRQDVMGFVAGLFHLDRLAREAMSDLELTDQDASAYVFDSSVPKERRLVYRTDGGAASPPAAAGICADAPFEVGRDSWLVEVCPMDTAAAVALLGPTPWLGGYTPAWLVLAAGLAMTLFLSLYLALILGQKEEAAGLVSEKTRALAMSHADLVSQMARRVSSEELLRKTNRALLVLGKCNFLLGQVATERQLLDGVCRIIVEDGGYVMAWVGFAQLDAERRVLPVAITGDTQGYLDSIVITWDEGPRGRGPAGQAVRSGRSHVARNVRTDPDFAPWRQAAIASGFGSVAGLPLRDETRIFGAIVIYAPEPDAFDERELQMLESLAENVSHGIAALRTRKQHEIALEAMRENEQRFRATFEQAAVGVCHIAPDGRFLRVNQKFCNIVGLDQDALLESRVDNLMHPDDVAVVRKQRRMLLQGEAPTFSRELRLIRPDGRLVWVNRTISAVREATPNYLIAVFQDVTDAKRMEAELLQAQKMDAVGRLTGGLAHDFNNLLGVVLGNLDVVYERLPADSRLKDFVRRAVGAAERGAGLVQRLLAFSRKQMLQPVVVDVNDLVREMVGLLRSSLGEEIAVETVLADDLWPARVDAGQLENTLLNLALNARDAMPEGGVLTITTGNLHVGPGDRTKPTDLAPGDHVALVVRDTGVGMTPEVRERAFEPFFTTKDVGQGTGLGLSMVHGFVKQSGGTVALSSAEGEGTEVTIFLPRAADEEVGARETAA